MSMSMRLASRIDRSVRVLVMGIVDMPMLVLQRLVLVFVLMCFREVQ
jgi:hypothetical protein